MNTYCYALIAIWLFWLGVYSKLLVTHCKSLDTDDWLPFLVVVVAPAAIVLPLVGRILGWF